MAKRYTITKNFGEYPFAHRQPAHSGHCAHIHGHNWSFILELGADELDEQNGFVFDFGQFGPLKEYLRQQFDHTLLIQEDDPICEDAEFMAKLHEVARIIMVPSVSCESIARYFYNRAVHFLNYETDAGLRVSVLSVTVTEDLKNSATYRNIDEQG